MVVEGGTLVDISHLERLVFLVFAVVWIFEERSTYIPELEPIVALYFLSFKDQAKKKEEKNR